MCLGGGGGGASGPSAPQQSNAPGESAEEEKQRQKNRDRLAAEEQIANMEANPSAPQMGGPGSAANLKGQRSRGEGHWAPEPEPGGIKRAGSERKSYTKQSDRY